jgi:hypothetical protein
MSESVFGVKKASSVSKVNTSSGSGNSSHSFTEEERISFSDWINDCLGKDPDLKELLPIKPESNQLFERVHNGLLLAKLINDAVPDTIDERVLNKGKLSVFKIHENQTLVINSAKSIGVNVINMGSQDLMDGTAHLVLGLIWQIIKIGLLSKINLKNHPELYRLLEPGETIEDLLKLPPDQLLIRWVNYHLRAAGHPRRINNFGGDIKDSEAYTILLKQIAPKNLGVDTTALSESDPTKRADKMLGNADKMGCRKFVRPTDVVAGNPKLNLAFVANLFNHFPALEPVEVVEELIEETREEKTFRNWMNSLGVAPFVNNLYEDLRDGLVLLQLFDKIQPGIVNWNKVNQPPFKAMGGNMKKVENCNYAVELGKQLNFSMVGIAGKDILDGNKTLTLAVVWQMMRAYVLSILTALSSDGKRITDNEIVAWVNSTLQGAGKSSTINGFKDDNIKTSKPVVDLVDALRPGSIDYALIYNTTNEKDLLKNAQYAVSSARKIGAVVFALPEDIVEVKPKMLLTIFAALMAVGLSK